MIMIIDSMVLLYGVPNLTKIVSKILSPGSENQPYELI